MLLPGSRPIRVLITVLGGAIASLSGQDKPASIEELLEEARYEEALPLIEEREAEWNAAVQHDDSLEYRLGWAKALLLLGMVEDRLNKFEPALQHLRLARDLAIEAEAGPQTVGDHLDALGRAQHRAGHYPESEASLRSAIEEWSKLPSAEREPWLSSSKDHLGLLFLTTGRYEEAGRLFHETLASAGGDRKVLAQRHGYLGKYFHTMQSYATACQHLERALELATDEWGEEHPNVVSLTGQLGLACFRLAPTPDGGRESPELMRARRLLRKAADLASQQPESHQVTLALATYLNNLGHLALREDRFEDALRIFTDSLHTLTRRLGDDSPVLAPFYNNVGFANQRLEKLIAAQDAYHQAAVRYRYSVGTTHQRYVEARLNLVECRLLASGPTEEISGEVAKVVEEALSLFDYLIDFGTERQRLNYLQQVDLVSLPCSLATDPVLIASTLQRTKGRLLDSLLAAQAESGDLLARLRTRQRQLDDLLFRFERRESLRELRDEITAIEAQLLAEPGQDLAESSPAADWPAIQATLPPRSAFVDYVRYRNYQAGSESPYSYGAILLLPDGKPHWVPLGTEEKLLTWLAVMKERLDYRASLLSSKPPRAPPALRLRSALRQIHDLFWAPVAALLPTDTETIGISPDGSLNFVSFAVLLDRDGRFLADTFPQIVYSASARDLLVNEKRPALREGPWALLAVPEFEPAESVDPTSSASALDRVVLETVDSLPPVPGARDELRRLRGIIPPTARGTEIPDATEADLRRLPASPLVLHLSTHAFFLPTAGESEVRGVQDFDHQPERLYRSGLVLAEAKRALAQRVKGADIPVEQDGVLFSDEAKSLPLQDTRLVTLSSCESGLGESVSGEGILGLRRGFTVAGTSNLLISLWPVSDHTTPEFMERMYRLALATDRIGQSLWETQRRALAKVDPDKDAELEQAVLRYGCFVLSQRGPLEAAVPMPELEDPFDPWWIITAVGVTALFAFLIIRPGKRRT